MHDLAEMTDEDVVESLSATSFADAADRRAVEERLRAALRGLGAEVGDYHASPARAAAPEEEEEEPPTVAARAGDDRDGPRRTPRLRRGLSAGRSRS